MKKVLDYSFVIEEVEIRNASFDLKRIVGSDHPSYIGKTWANMINNLRRESNIKALFLDEDREYGSISYYKKRDEYKDNEDPWGFTVINDNEAYICEGNHRTVIAKFLNALDLIDSNINALKYVKYLKFDYKEARKFYAIKKWLNKYYYMYHIDLEAKRVLVNNYVNKEITTNEYKIEYIIKHNYTFEEIDGKMEKVLNCTAFDDIKTLKKCLRDETSQLRKEWHFKNKVIANTVLNNTYYALRKRLNKS